MVWTALTFAFGSVLTSTKMTQLYDNITAQANGDSGAPKQQTAGIADGAVTQAKLSTTEVTTLSGSVGISSEVNITLAATGYCFFPMIHMDRGSVPIGQITMTGHSVDAADGDSPRFAFANENSNYTGGYDVDYRSIDA